jgi:hypothetical protein
VTLEALREVDQLTFVELLDQLLALFAIVQTLLQGLEEDSVELLDILLIECLIVMPLEGFDQFAGCGLVAGEFKFPEEFLQLEGNAIFTFGV